MQERERASLERMAGEIQAVRSGYEAMIERLRPIVREHPEQANPDEASGEFWRTIFFYDALIRIRLLIEQNFSYIETLGLLATTRYLFELLVWARALSSDARYGFVYHAQLIDRQLKYWIDFKDHVGREILMLREFEREEERLQQEAKQDANSIAEALTSAAAEVDRKAARRFSIYAEQALRNGYGFQAHLVEQKVLPEMNSNVAETKAKLELVKSRVPKEVKSLVSDWQWKSQAVKVGMAGEYDFIYTYCSRLLHATPPSISTDMKNLETSEMVIFLRFVRVGVHDFLDLATAHCNSFMLH